MISYEILGERICIIGCSSSGKSTLASVLSDKTKIPLYHLDLLAHKPNTNWERVSNEILITEHNKIITTHKKWIIEGNYSVCMEKRFSNATSVIWLDLSSISNVFRYIIRSIKKDPKRPGKLRGAKKEWNIWLIKHILFVYPKNRKKYQSILKNYSNLTIIRITSFRQLKKYYEFLELTLNKQL